MGVVYRARHADLGREVALKVLKPAGPAGPSQPDRLLRFRREMDVLMALSHPNVVKILDAGEVDGQLYFAMELLDADDLASLLKEPRMPVGSVLSILDQLLDALDYIHAKNLVHRDIKPANIMVDRTGRAVLLDFGIVRDLDGTVLTAPETILGTPRYFAPEILSLDPATASADLWGLGVVTYEMLAGEPPFTGSTLAALASEIRCQDPVPVAVHRPELPAELAGFVHRFLEKDPGQRWPSARAARDELHRIIAGMENTPKRDLPRKRMSTARRARPPAIPRGALALFLAAALLGGWLFVRTGPGVPPPRPTPSIRVGQASGSPGTEDAPSRAALVRRLSLAVRSSALDERTIDLVWKEVRQECIAGKVDFGEPGHLRAAVARSPGIAGAVDRYAAALLAAHQLGEAYTAVRPAAGQILGDDAAPSDLRSELLTALSSLDRVDALAEFVGRKPPFGVQADLAPAVVVSAADTEQENPPGARLDRCRTLPETGSAGVLVWRPEELVGGQAPSLALFGHSLSSRPWPIQGMRPVTALEFEDRSLPGAMGRRFHFRITGLSPGFYLWLTPPRSTGALPVRLPASPTPDADHTIWLSVSLRGAMAAPGAWSCRQVRAFENSRSIRFFYAVHRIVAETI